MTLSTIKRIKQKCRHISCDNVNVLNLNSREKIFNLQERFQISPINNVGFKMQIFRNKE